MQVQSMHFKARAKAALGDTRLQAGLAKVDGFAKRRADVVADYADFDTLRLAGAAIRDRTLQDLDAWIERFEREGHDRALCRNRRGGRKPGH